MKFQDSEYDTLSLTIRISAILMAFRKAILMDFQVHDCLKIIYVTIIYGTFLNSLNIKEIRNNTKPLQYITIFFLLYLREV